MVWRGIVEFILFSAVYFVTGIALGLLFSLTAFISGGWPTSWIPIAASVAGSVAGVFAAVFAVGMLLKKSPAKWVGILFIVINLAVVISDLVIVPAQQWDRWFWAQVAGFLTAAATAIYVFWFGNRNPWTTPKEPNHYTNSK